MSRRRDFVRASSDATYRKWTSLLNVLGDLEGTLSQSYTVRDKKTLEALLDDERFGAADKMQFVELVMEKMDAPRALKAQAKLSGKTNAYVKTTEAMTGAIAKSQ